MRRAGFTLLELLMVVVVVGILAGVALPQYNKTVERGYQRQARDILHTIYAGQQAYHATTDDYTDQWDEMYMDDPNQPPGGPIGYSISGTPGVFTATATRNGGTLCNGKTMTINQAKTWGGTGWATCP